MSTKSGGSATFSKSLSSDDEKGTAADSKTPVKVICFGIITYLFTMVDDQVL